MNKVPPEYHRVINRTAFYKAISDLRMPSLRDVREQKPQPITLKDRAARLMHSSSHEIKSRATKAYDTLDYFDRTKADEGIMITTRHEITLLEKYNQTF